MLATYYAIYHSLPSLPAVLESPTEWSALRPTTWQCCHSVTIATKLWRVISQRTSHSETPHHTAVMGTASLRSSYIRFDPVYKASTVCCSNVLQVRRLPMITSHVVNTYCIDSAASPAAPFCLSLSGSLARTVGHLVTSVWWCRGEPGVCTGHPWWQEFPLSAHKTGTQRKDDRYCLGVPNYSETCLDIPLRERPSVLTDYIFLMEGLTFQWHLTWLKDPALRNHFLQPMRWSFKRGSTVISWPC